MAKEKFGVAVDEEVVQEVDELVAECDDLGASRSEIVGAILTAFVQSESNRGHITDQFDLETVEAVGNTLLQRNVLEKVPDRPVEVVADLHLDRYYGEEDGLTFGTSRMSRENAV